MKRKLSLVALLAAVCGFMLTGCNDNSTSTPPSTNAAPSAPPTPAPPSTNAPK